MATLTNSPTISTEPWSNYAEADYDLAQWHNACLIHQHVGPPSSKAQCKLAVKTPNGILNRNGVFAAAGALAGARTPLNATPEQKAKAAAALRGLYSKIGAKPPASLLKHSDILEHHGVKGMHWGVHSKSAGGTRSPIAGYRKLKDMERVRNLKRVQITVAPKHSKAEELSDDDLRKAIARMNLEQQYNSLIRTKDNQLPLHQGETFVKQMAKRTLEAAILTTTAALVKRELKKHGIIPPKKGD